MKTSIGQICLLGILLTSPAWACDMGGLFWVVLMALAIGAALCALVSALVAWAIRSKPLASPFLTLVLSVISGTAIGTGGGLLAGLAMADGNQFLWVTLLLSVILSSAIVTLAPSASRPASLKLDEPSGSPLEPAADIQGGTTEWKTLS